MTADEMTCKELVELVTEYLEGTLSTLDSTRFEEHLAECPGCRTYLQQMRQTIRVLGRLPEEALSADSREELLRAFRTWKRG
jgi:predicted anti-sigma-YlaC factor YlaD